MSEDAIAALQYDYGTRLAPGNVSDDLEANPFCEEGERGKINCPEPGCNKQCQVVELDGEKQFLCRDRHTNPYDEALHKYWKVKTDDAVTALLSDLGYDTARVDQQGRIIRVDRDRQSLLLVPGTYGDDLLETIGTVLKETRNLCVIAFQEETKDGVKPVIDRFGGLAMLVTPPALERKLANFESMVAIRDRIEDEYALEREDVPEELLKKIHDNPQFVLGELADFEKIQSSDEKRHELEQICTLVFSQLMDCPLNSLGMADPGQRVPDGFGFIFDDTNNNRPLFVLDSKSVSSSRRDYPDITEKDGPQYRKYLEIIDDICFERQIAEKALVFISPAYNRSKIEDFLDELERTKFDTYRVIFIDLEALITLLLFRSTLASDRKVRLNRGRWHSMLYSLFMDPVYDRAERDYELERKQGLILEPTVIEQHFAERLSGQGNREQILATVEDQLREYVPE